MNIFNLLILSLSISGFGVIMWTWLVDHPVVSQWLKTRMPFFGKILHCGVCLMSWISFLFVLIFNPFLEVNYLWRIEVGMIIKNIVEFIITWFSVSALAIFFRYFILVWIELLKYFIKTINAK